MLLASAGAQQTGQHRDGMPDVVEAAPHDFFWGRGSDGSGSNHLGALLMRLRASLLSSPVQEPMPTHAAPKEMVWDTMPAGC